MSERIALPNPPQAVFIDAGGVLIVPNMAKVATHLGLSEDTETMLDAFAASNDRPDAPDGSEDSRHRWLWTEFLRSLGHDPDDTRFASFLRGLEDGPSNPWFPATAGPGVLEALKRLALAVPQIAVVSNSNGVVERELASAGICQVDEGEGTCIAVVIDSTVVGVSKPDPGIFKLAFDAVEATADEVVHIGDSAWTDMEGARRSNIAGIHISRTGACSDQTHWHARDFSAAVDLLLPDI